MRLNILATGASILIASALVSCDKVKPPPPSLPVPVTDAAPPAPKLPAARAPGTEASAVR